jgi:hypothetical protein
MDYQVLRDQLLSTKMNLTHARWRNNVLSQTSSMRDIALVVLMQWRMD